MTHPTLTALRKAARGLMYMSEKDAPFRVVALETDEPVTKKNILKLTASPEGAPVSEEKFDRVFGLMSQDQKWHGEDEKAIVKKYQHLTKVLLNNLSDLRIFKIGQGQLKVYIVGKTREGLWLGLQTESLET